jgi:predicted dehydrogenase
MHLIKTSVVGLRGHAGKHIQLLRKNPKIVLDKIYYYKSAPAGFEDLPVTHNLADCLNSDLIIVSSPTAAHYEHLEVLRDFQGYIFLEKPAVNNKEHIAALLEWPADFKSRIRVNFNFVHSELGTLMARLIEGGDLGRIFAFDVHSSHGAAFKKEWVNAWRIVGETGLGPVETTGIHYAHFASKFFGQCRRSSILVNCLTGKHATIDTGILNMETVGQVWVRIRHSYAAPYAVHLEIWGTEGYFVYNDPVACLYHPRNSFDAEGLYTTPPVKDSWKMDFKKVWSDSLIKAQDNFIETVYEKRLLDPTEFDHDVSIMKYLLV